MNVKTNTKRYKGKTNYVCTNCEDPEHERITIPRVRCEYFDFRDIHFKATVENNVCGHIFGNRWEACFFANHTWHTIYQTYLRNTT